MPVTQFMGVPVVMLSSLKSEEEGGETIEFDMVEEVTITEENLVTQNPTETGAVVGDHIVQLPVSIRLVGRFVDYPLPELVGPGVLTAFTPAASLISAVVGIAGLLEEDDARGRSISMWQALERMRERTELLTVNVQQGTYESMAIKNLSGPRARGDGGSQRFQIDLLEMIITTDPPRLNMSSELGYSGNPLLDLGVQALGDVFLP